jgi:hypothetical protein
VVADGSKEQSSETKGPLSAADTPKRDLSVHPLSPELIADGFAMRQLCASLDTLVTQYGEVTEADAKIILNRPNVIAMLTSLHLGLREQLARPTGSVASSNDDLDIKFEHPVVSLLRNLIGAFVDLENAKTHPVFDTPDLSRGASLLQSEIRARDEQLALVDVLQIVAQLPKRAVAERKLAAMMRKQIGHKAAPSAEAIKEKRKTRNRQARRVKKK